MKRARKKRFRDTRLPAADLRAAHAFLGSMFREGTPATYMIPGYVGFTKDQYWASYHQWYKGGRAWDVLEVGGTYVMIALMWYHHVHRPGSREWRPSRIIPAVVEAALAYVAAAEPASGSPAATEGSDR